MNKLSLWFNCSAAGDRAGTGRCGTGRCGTGRCGTVQVMGATADLFPTPTLPSVRTVTIVGCCFVCNAETAGTMTI